MTQTADDQGNVDGVFCGSDGGVMCVSDVCYGDTWYGISWHK